ncbi:MAG TPA: winged helix-turn-helix domain-containing protein, partial [Steroidobacteraceae bacterium]|nr:winged helix-turn-helix domain-containing protein [Steroidobacteraceae bacterium]
MPLRPMPIRFGPFCLHPTQGLTRDGCEIRITPKSQAVLHALADRPGRIVTKDELLGAVWPNTLVTDAALSSCIRELRRALHDDARRPHYIETVHRRGFRLLAPVDRSDSDGSAAPALRNIVGRETLFAELTRIKERVQSGSRETVFVTGAAGAGKTTLVDAFLTSVAHGDAWPLGRAEC